MSTNNVSLEDIYGCKSKEKVPMAAPLTSKVNHLFTTIIQTTQTTACHDKAGSSMKYTSYQFITSKMCGCEISMNRTIKKSYLCIISEQIHEIAVLQLLYNKFRILYTKCNSEQKISMHKK